MSDSELRPIYIRIYRLISIHNFAYRRGDSGLAGEAKYLLDGHYETVRLWHVKHLPDSAWNMA
jgi:hypothetical protein